MVKLAEYVEIQSIAKFVLSELADSIQASDTELTIAQRAKAFLSSRGITETWYYDCPAFVLLGSRSSLSISGRSYVAASEPVGSFNLITIDLSPLRNGIWGDCARSFPVEHGRCTFSPQSKELAEGIEVEASLHKSLASFVKPTTTFDELFSFGNAQIIRLGFENLDHLGNLGHSIASLREDRCYIEPGNLRLLGSVPFFTFEPHVRRLNGKWGFKHEEIYFFDSDERLHAL